MQAAQALSANTTTFLTHIFGHGLADDSYVVERFKSMVDGDIRPVQVEAPKGKRKAKRAIMSLKAVKDMRPANAEIIICTGLRTKGGVQYWGLFACGLFHDRKQR